MKGRHSGAVFLFLGVLLTFCFGVGLAWSRNPGLFHQAKYYDFALDQFLAFCGYWWLPLGIIGIPMFLISLIVSLYREHRNR